MMPLIKPHLRSKYFVIFVSFPFLSDRLYLAKCMSSSETNTSGREMYIRGLFPRNFAELAKTVPIDTKHLSHLYVLCKRPQRY